MLGRWGCRSESVCAEVCKELLRALGWRNDVAIFSSRGGSSSRRHLHGWEWHRRQSERRPMTFDDLISLHRVSDPQMSPDGRYVAYTVATPDREANRVAPNIWVVPTAGGEPRQLTRGGSDQRPRWSPDGTKLAFLSARDGNQQVYWISLAGGEATRLTSLSGGADNELWSPDGKTIAFVSSVYPDCADDDCNVKRDAEKQKSKVKAHVATKLLYRHWTTWSDGKRSHLFAISRGWRQGARSDARRGLRRAAFQSGRAGSDCDFRRTARRLDLRRTRIRTKRSARTAIFSPCR